MNQNSGKNAKKTPQNQLPEMSGAYEGKPPLTREEILFLKKRRHSSQRESIRGISIHRRISESVCCSVIAATFGNLSECLLQLTNKIIPRGCRSCYFICHDDRWQIIHLRSLRSLHSPFSNSKMIFGRHIHRSVKIDKITICRKN